jgi:hypothetical protein
VSQYVGCRIIQIIPADGWRAVFRNDDDPKDPLVNPLVAWGSSTRTGDAQLSGSTPPRWTTTSRSRPA